MHNLIILQNPLCECFVEDSNSEYSDGVSINYNTPV